jgi:hypothetical protein
MTDPNLPAIEETSSKNRRAKHAWAAIFVIAMVGGGLGAKAMHLGPYVTMGVMALAMLLLFPLVRATEKAQADGGYASPAFRRYNRRMMFSTFGYMLALFAAILAQRLLNPGGLLLGMVALLPAIPILHMLWGMKIYLTEEQDEYLRLRFMNAALIGTGILLALATVWGFLETFHVAPHAAGWLGVPVWAVGMGLGQWIDRWRKA